MKSKAINKKHILITGATGYIGSYLSKNLSKDAFEITTISNSQENLSNHTLVDLSKEKQTHLFSKSLKSVDIIIHCAAIAHGQKPPKGFSVGNFNSIILKNLVSAFKDQTPHWIFLSSISVYGDAHSDKNIPLIKRPKPFNSYGIGKLNDEEYLMKNCQHLDIFRLMPVYDEKNLDDIKKRVYFPKTNIKILISPSPIHSLCNIKEVLYAVQNCMQFSKGQRYSNVGDTKPLKQSVIASWFDGKVFYLPQFIFKVLFKLLPKKFTLSRNIAFLIKKFALNNIYKIEIRSVK